MIGIYAAQYKNVLPQFSTAAQGGWLTDEPIDFGDNLLNLQTSSLNDPNSFRRVFYCPSNPEQNVTAM